MLAPVVEDSDMFVFEGLAFLKYRLLVCVYQFTVKFTVAISVLFSD